MLIDSHLIDTKTFPVVHCIDKVLKPHQLVFCSPGHSLVEFVRVA